jgi:hypothetical protein
VTEQKINDDFNLKPLTLEFGNSNVNEAYYITAVYLAADYSSEKPPLKIYNKGKIV